MWCPSCSSCLNQEPTNRRWMGPRTSLHAVKDKNPCLFLTIQPVTLLTVIPLHNSMYIYALTSAQHIPSCTEYNNENSQLSLNITNFTHFSLKNKSSKYYLLTRAYYEKQGQSTEVVHHCYVVRSANSEQLY